MLIVDCIDNKFSVRINFLYLKLAGNTNRQTAWPSIAWRWAACLCRIV